MPEHKIKTIIIMGPTASGKTTLAVNLARSFNGEIISADSRQIFKKMDIGTGKDLDEYGDIQYHLIDILNPGEEFSVSKFIEAAHVSLSTIHNRKKFPIICGGTGHYIKALIEDYHSFKNNSDLEFTRNLEKLSRQELYLKLKKNGLWKNHHWQTDSKRRMARAIERHLIKANQPSKCYEFKKHYRPKIFYKAIERDRLKHKILHRLQQRINQGLIQEVEGLLADGIPFDRLQRYGLEYKWVSRYLYHQMSYDEMFQKLFVEICRYAKRQMTFIRYLKKAGHKIHPIEDESKFHSAVEDWIKND